MAKCIFEGLTEKQALTMAKWFEGAGEQDCESWFDASDIPSPKANVRRDGGYLDILPNNDCVVYCR